MSIEDPTDYAFQALSGMRESISIAKRQPAQVPYEAALDIIHEVNPKAYTFISDILTKRNKSDEVRYFSEKADALSTEDKIIMPVDLIDKELLEIEMSIRSLKEKRKPINSLSKRKINLLAAKEYFSPRRVSEHKILNGDFYLASLNLPDAIEIYKDHQFKDFKLANDRYLRLGLLHPDVDEHITGADMIYEQFDLENEKVRFVHVQYKLWAKTGLYLNSGNVMAQVTKMANNLCNSNYCHTKEGHNTGSGFRFPFCSGFLRPTDKQVDNGKDMTSTGLHLPICYVKRLAESSSNKIDKATAKSNGISHNVFDEMFVNCFLGSRWIPISELEDYYTERGIEHCTNSIRVHAQEIYLQTESERARKQGE